MLKKILLSLLAVLLIAAIWLYLRGYSAPLPADSESAKMLQPGPFQVSSEEVELVDTSRATPKTEAFAGSDTRLLKTRIWWPEGGLGTPRPLVVYSHGFMSSNEGGLHVAEHLASHGYIVAAATYPLTSYDAPRPQSVEDVVNQPGDVKFIIDTLIERSQSPQDKLAGSIDSSRIAKFGMSLGGMTTKLVTYHRQYFDPRIAVAVSVAGPSNMFKKEFFNTRNIPFLMIASKIDAMITYDDNAADITERVPNATLLSFEDGSHAGFSYQSRGLRFLDNADSLACYFIADNANSATESDDMWIDNIGRPEDGVTMPPPSRLCTEENLQRAMNPIRQQELEIVAITSFFQSHFADSESERDAHRQFLMQQLPAEHPQLTIH